MTSFGVFEYDEDVDRSQMGVATGPSLIGVQFLWASRVGSGWADTRWVDQAPRFEAVVERQGLPECAEASRT